MVIQLRHKSQLNSNVFTNNVNINDGNNNNNNNKSLLMAADNVHIQAPSNERLF